MDHVTIARQALASLGFSSFSVSKTREIIVKARTSKGWTYEKFSPSNTLADDIAAWARGQEPA